MTDSYVPPQSPEWPDLKTYANSLKQNKRQVGQQPYSVSQHFFQRLGRTQQWEKNRQVMTSSGQPITELNYQQAIKNLSRIGWINTDASDLRRLQEVPDIKFPETWSPPESGDGIFVEDALIKAINVEKSCKSATNLSKEVGFKKAWREICALVEPSVLKQVGMPEIHILEDTDEGLGDAPGDYDAKSQLIRLKARNATERIRHEFGHHIEDQGPVEVWLAAATLLQRLATKDGALTQLIQGSKYQNVDVAYGIDSGAAKAGTVYGMPQLNYSFSYYSDGGTELLSIGLEEDISSIAHEAGRKVAAAEGGRPEESEPERLPSYRTDYLVLLMRAFRPKAWRMLGGSSPSVF